MKKSKIIFGVLRLPLDFIAIMAALLLAYYIRPLTDLIPGIQFVYAPELLPNFDDYFRFSIYASIFLILLFVFFGKMYSMKNTEKFGRTFLKIILWVSAWLMFIIAYYFLIVHQLFFSRIALAHIWLLTIVFVGFVRFVIILLQSFLLRFNIGRTRVLIVGVNQIADQCYEKLKNDRHYMIIGALAEKLESRKMGSLKIVGTYDQLEQIVKKYNIEEIIQADEERASDLLGYCRSNQIKYYFIPDLLRIQRTNVEMEMVDDIPLISLKQTPLEGWGAVWKRIFDFLFALIFIIILIPVWLVVSFAIKFDSKGPIIYKSKRQYRDKIFNVYKFRSMRVDADKIKTELIEQNERKGPLFKIKNDPRITKLGRFIRKTSIDELPQLFNVFIGNMSLVGPRPHLPEEVEQYKKHHYQVFAIKPGVTGLAQTRGRSNLDFEEEVKLDVYYIENWSPWFDIKIILKSIAVVLKADGC
ncbi:sugar transferase [Candidatus Peregrinibacteria bacterium]|nr:sugar transferase [Candidatus Peregrinibacteria bacterium]